MFIRQLNFLSVVLLFSIAKCQTNSGLRTAQSPTSFEYHSYQRSAYCSPSTTIRSPNNAAEVQQIVLTAISNGTTVKAFGSRHSITDIICTDGTPISMQNINYTIDNADGTATFGAGIEVIDALAFLEGLNKTLIHVPSFSGITIGGAIGTGAHGSSLVHPTSISDQVVALTVIDGHGTIRTISNPNEVNKFRVHLGLLGIIIDVTLQTVPLFKMKVKNYPESESILFDGTALNWARQYDWYQMWWFPSSGNVIVSKGNYTQDITVPGNASTNLIPNENPLLITASNEAFELLQKTRNQLGEIAFQTYTELSLYTLVVGKPPIFSENGVILKNPAIGYGWRLQSNKCTNVCTWSNGPGNSVLPQDYSVSLDISQFPAVFAMIKNILSKYPAVFEMIGIFIRFSKPSNALMATSHGRQTFSVEWIKPMRSNPYETPNDGIGAYQAILQEMVTNFGGRPHWGKNGLHYLSPQVLSTTAPNRQAFIQAMQTYDPNGIFLNKFGNRILGNSNATDKNPAVTRCALQDYCICSSASDCAPFQTCTKVNGFNVCKDILPTINLPLPLHFNGFSNLTDILNVIGVL